MTAAAGRWLDPGEALVAATWGATSGIGVLLGTAKGRIAAVSDRNVYVFESTLWGRISRPRRVVARHARGSVAVRLDGWHLHVGNHKMLVQAHHRAQAAVVADLASRPAEPAAGAGAGAAAAPAAPRPARPVEGQVLEVDGLRRAYGDRVALDGLTFTVTPGHLFGFLGPNGAGKTTAMRIMLGIDRPDAGEVRWAGKPVDQDTRMRFGYMPEQRGLYPKMRVGEQLAYLATLHGVPDHEAAASAASWLARLGLGDRADERLDRLSHGNQQRAQLAAALVHDPWLLVLDEPFSGLDPIGVRAMVEVLAERVEAGATVVFSSHQLDLVEDICDEVAIIDRGRVVLAGKVAELKAAGRRSLVVKVAGAGHDWLGDLGLAARAAGATGHGEDDASLRIDLGGVDPQVVLDRARAAGRVEHFGIEQPTLSELFLQAVA